MVIAYSIEEFISAWAKPAGTTLLTIKTENNIKRAKIKVNINNLDPCSSVFSHEAPIDSKTLLSSNIIWAAYKENLAVK